MRAALRQSRILIIISSCFLFAGILFGLMTGIILEDLFIEPIVPGFDFSDYLTCNLSAMAITMTGILYGGISSIEAVFAHGFIIGMAIQNAQKIYSISQVLLLILPHGFFELIALILSGAVGLFGWKIFKGILDRSLSLKVIIDLVILISIALVSIVIGALIEANITPLFL